MNKVLMLLLLASSFGLAQSKGGSNAAHRVLIEINSPDHETWDMALRNIANLQQAFGTDHIEIEAVVLGKGIDLVLGSDAEYADRLGALSRGGVTFAACQNTMRQRHIAKQDLLPFVVTVDSGVAELVRKQEAGWVLSKNRLVSL
jgi:intracellular sulfur oxidation DsrE/DsrF family protein